MNFWVLNLSPGDIAGEIFSPGAKGTLNADMVFYAEKKGLNVKVYASNFSDLEKNFDAGIPLIVKIDGGFWVYQQTHFMVVVGYNEGSIIANSGTKQHESISREHFLKTWAKMKFWTLRIGPK